MQLRVLTLKTLNCPLLHKVRVYETLTHPTLQLQVKVSKTLTYSLLISFLKIKILQSIQIFKVLSSPLE